jgi:predicted small metal-binding protein
VQKVLHCDCGFEARGEDEDELVREVQRHALDAHGMAITRAQVLALAARAEPDESITGRE